jgi:hypothetical protein
LISFFLFLFFLFFFGGHFWPSSGHPLHSVQQAPQVLQCAVLLCVAQSMHGLDASGLGCIALANPLQLLHLAPALCEILLKLNSSEELNKKKTAAATESVICL